jgi:hypothetical protein
MQEVDPMSSDWHAGQTRSAEIITNYLGALERARLVVIDTSDPGTEIDDWSPEYVLVDDGHTVWRGDVPAGTVLGDDPGNPLSIDLALVPMAP